MSTHPNGRSLLVALKLAAGLPGAQLGLSVSNGLWLRPVPTREDLQRAEDVRNLTEWRNRYQKSFLTEFEATDSQTSLWLAETVGPSDNRILFMIDNCAGETVGHMGIGFIDWERGYGEADAIVKGVDVPKGSMATALKTLVGWGQGQLQIRTFGVRVRSDNPAIEFYRKLGFVEQRRVPLSRRVEGQKVIWFENPNEAASNVSLVHHLLGAA